LILLGLLGVQRVAFPGGLPRLLAGLIGPLLQLLGGLLHVAGGVGELRSGVLLGLGRLGWVAVLQGLLGAALGLACLLEGFAGVVRGVGG